MIPTGTQRMSGNSKKELGLLLPHPFSSQLQPSLIAQEASQSPRDRDTAAKGPSYISGQEWPGREHAAGCGALVDRGPRSLSSWERARSGAGGGQCSFAVSEGSREPMKLLLMDETTKAGGASRSPCPGLLPQGLGIPGPSHATQRNSFGLFYTLSSGKKGFFSKTELENVI